MTTVVDFRWALQVMQLSSTLVSTAIVATLIPTTEAANARMPSDVELVAAQNVSRGKLISAAIVATLISTHWQLMPECQAMPQEIVMTSARFLCSIPFQETQRGFKLYNDKGETESGTRTHLVLGRNKKFKSESRR